MACGWQCDGRCGWLAVVGTEYYGVGWIYLSMLAALLFVHAPFPHPSSLHFTCINWFITTCALSHHVEESAGPCPGDRRR